VTVVLLVEDEEPLRRQLSWLLEASGFITLRACSLAEADSAIAAVDAVVVHLGLPSRSRELAFRAWHAQRPDLVVIDVSRPGETPTEGVDVCLKPPFSGDWLAGHLSDMIREPGAYAA
jgi:DNA-binding response OmpR family regulator